MLSMLLTSPGDNPSSLPTAAVQQQPHTETTENQYSSAGDGVPSGQSCEPPSNRSCVNASETLVSKALTTAPEIVEAVSLVPLPLSQPSRSQKARAQESELDGLYALRQAGGLNALRRERTPLLGKGTLAKLHTSTADGSVESSSFAAPLAPLRAGDMQALSELFSRDDIFAIEVDVSQRLLALLPEPCWEDDVFAFLGKFL